MGRINYYKQSTKIEMAGSKYLDAIYKKYFGAKKIIKNTNRTTQIRGVDKLIYLPNRKLPIRVEEKYRSRWYGDILLEYISNDTTGRLGWIEKSLLCDYIFYAINNPITKVFWFNWEQLKTLWELNKAKWIVYGEQNIHGFNKIVAKNVGYNTISVAVPVQTLLNNIKNSGVKELCQR